MFEIQSFFLFQILILLFSFHFFNYFSKLTHSWKSQEYSAQKEFEMQITDLMINKDQALSDLDNEWQSPKKQQLYSKPSPALLNMRHMAKKMIRTQQFEEVKKLARLIEDKEKQEIVEAAKRMDEDYHIADQRLNEQYDHEQKIIESMYDMKLHNIARSREQNLRPLYQRIENLQKMKDQASKAQKKAAQLVTASTPRKRGANSNVVSSSATPRYLAGKSTSRVAKVTANGNKNSNPQKQLPQLLVTPKLALPPVRRIQRDGAKSQIAQTSMMQGQQQQQQQQTQQPSLYRPKALSRLSNSAIEKNSSKKTTSPKYH